jgi:hypothetical protein
MSADPTGLEQLPVYAAKNGVDGNDFAEHEVTNEAEKAKAKPKPKEAEIKTGFKTPEEAARAAYKDWQAQVKAGTMVISEHEYAAAIYTTKDSKTGETSYHNGEWVEATAIGSDGKNSLHSVAYPKSEDGIFYTNIHSHKPSDSNGANPSGRDIITAQGHKDEKGKFAYSYLINNKGDFQKYKPIRIMNSYPFIPRLGQDYMN